MTSLFAPAFLAISSASVISFVYPIVSVLMPTIFDSAFGMQACTLVVELENISSAKYMFSFGRSQISPPSVPGRYTPNETRS